MNIPKAIDQLNLLLEDSPYIPSPITKEAIKLGIEALKRVEMYQKSPLVGNPLPLPSETKE